MLTNASKYEPDTGESNDEKDLFRLIAAGDEQAFARLHSSYKDRLLYYGKRFLAEWPEVEDIVSEAFLKLWLARADMQSDTHISNFLYRTVRHRAIDRQRALERRDHLLEFMKPAEETEGNQFEAEMVRVEMVSLLANAVDSLPDKYRRIFELSYHADRSPGEIASMLQINPDTVRSQKRRAIEMIRQWIKEKGSLLSLLLCCSILASVIL
ncbi:MAG: sigma-70 family RNA polymerase sigma factor [Chitinophagaceae bacterium]